MEECWTSQDSTEHIPRPKIPGRGAALDEDQREALASAIRASQNKGVNIPVAAMAGEAEIEGAIARATTTMYQAGEVAPSQCHYRLIVVSR